MGRFLTIVLSLVVTGLLLCAPGIVLAREEVIDTTLVDVGVSQILKLEEKQGAWPYEGVYRVGGDIPVGYHVGGTALVVEALVCAAPDDKKAHEAVSRGVSYILSKLSHPLMATSVTDRYDVRVWGHSYALNTFCVLAKRDLKLSQMEDIRGWIPRLIKSLLFEQLQDGGWNYANRKNQAPFVTAPVLQSLLLARSLGYEVADEVFSRGKAALLSSREDNGAFAYSGPVGSGRKTSRRQIPGSLARSPVCETTLLLLDGGEVKDIERSLQHFYKHWGELEKRRKKTGTHVPPYGIAPYYFYYGHRYLSQAIEMLPEKKRGVHRSRLRKLLVKTRDKEGTWNDRVFPRSRNFGTAMSVLALVEPGRAPLPFLKELRPDLDE